MNCNQVFGMISISKTLWAGLTCRLGPKSFSYQLKAEAVIEWEDRL